MVVWNGWSAFDNPNLVAFDCVKELDLTPLMIGNAFLAEPSNYLFYSFLLDIVKRHSSTPATQ